ncbi:hypothetical protein CO610_04265 [Lysobacteraceae bacterium NML95-0200]|nr:hypothetical protein CO610_04265 [Xanthomonadaceae bacterium NML95-0200]
MVIELAEISKRLVASVNGEIPPHPHDEITQLEVAIEKLGSEIALLNARRKTLQEGDELQQLMQEMTRLRTLQDSLSANDAQTIAEILTRQLS